MDADDNKRSSRSTSEKISSMYTWKTIDYNKISIIHTDIFDNLGWHYRS